MIQGSAPTDPGVTQSAATPGEQDIGRRVLRGTFWVALSRWGALLVTWPVTILLARILLPSDYGYLALVTVFTRFGRIVAESGISNTVLLGPKLSDAQYARLHGWSLSLFVGVGLLLAAAAVPVEMLYKSEGLRWVMLALTSSFLIEGLVLVPVARMRRDIRFKELAGSDALRSITEAVTSLSLAYAGFGYWSLVGGSLMGTAVYAVRTLRAAGMWPTRPSREGLESTLKNAKRLLVSSLTTFTAQSSDAWVGGAVVGAAGLGGYSYMSGLAFAPIEKISGIISYGTGSLLSGLHEDPERIGRAILRTTRISSLVMFPICTGLALVAPDLVAGVLGAQWVPYVIVLQVLCFHAVISPFYTAVSQGAIGLGHARAIAVNGIITLCLLPLSFFVLGKLFGALGLALALLVPRPLTVGRMIHVVNKNAKVTLANWGQTFRIPVLGVLLMSGAVLFSKQVPFMMQTDARTRLAISVVVGVVTYSAFVLTFAMSDIRWLRERVGR